MFLCMKHFDPIQWNANDRYDIYYILTDSNVACYVVENFIICISVRSKQNIKSFTLTLLKKLWKYSNIVVDYDYHSFSKCNHHDLFEDL